MIRLFYEYIKIAKTASNKILYRAGLLVFTIQTIFCMHLSGNYIFLAYASNCIADNIVDRITINLFQVQYWVVIFIMFYRLKRVFDGSKYALSKCTIVTFSIVYVTMIVTAIPVFLFYDESLENSGDLFAFFAFMTILATIFNLMYLSFLFVYKMVAVSRSVDDGGAQNKFLSSITKITIVSLTSIFSFVLWSIVLTIVSYIPALIDSSHGEFIVNLTMIGDCWTNFISILLSYNAFTAYYRKLCGCCDTKCKGLCAKVTGSSAVIEKKEKIDAERQLSTTDASVQDNVMSTTTSSEGSNGVVHSTSQFPTVPEEAMMSTSRTEDNADDTAADN